MRSVTEYIDAEALTAWVVKTGEHTPVWGFLAEIKKATNEDGKVPVQVPRRFPAKPQESLEEQVETAALKSAQKVLKELRAVKEAAKEATVTLDGAREARRQNESQAAWSREEIEAAAFQQLDEGPPLLENLAEAREKVARVKAQDTASREGLDEKYEAAGYKKHVRAGKVKTFLAAEESHLIIVDADPGDENPVTVFRTHLQEDGWYIGPFETYTEATNYHTR